MQLSRPDALGVPRDVAWAPTDDPARQRGLEPDLSFLSGRQWTPLGLVALGHQLTVNVATGGLVISINDLAQPYQALRFQVARSLDAQEHHAQATYLNSHPDTDPRIHLFANWQSAREAVVSEAWHETFPELLVADGDGGGALYYRAYPTFDINRTAQAEVEDVLRAYGVPGRTLAALGWRYEKFDTILRSLQGEFSLISGRYLGETLIDPAEVRLYRFDVTSGIGYRYSSEFAYQQLIDTDGARETTVQALLVDVVDALGHAVTFAPVEATPPYRTYRLADGSGRSLEFALGDHVDYLDANKPGGIVKTYVVSRVTDQTRATANVVTYRYAAGRLVEVRSAGHAGGADRVCRYDYDGAGNLIRITDPVGDTFTIEYVEDLLDTDERLIPRLKVRRLVDAEGNEAAYEYDHAAARVTVTFTGVGGDSRTAVYSYIEDEANTRQRYLASETLPVTSGYSGSQSVQTTWQYTGDGRYQPAAMIDPLGAVTRYEYNDFNQPTAVVEASGHRRDFAYDVRAGPTPAEPNRYDLLRVSEQNVDVDGNAFPVQTEATFGRYDAGTSTDPADAAQSTHRVATRTNELGAAWRFDYDDSGSFMPLRATSSTDPLGYVSTRAYDAIGALIRDTDPEGNDWQRAYNPQGQLVSLTDPNGFQRFWVYDNASGWLTHATDARGAAPGDPAHSVQYEWTAAGQRSRDRDPTGATIDYRYYANKRLRSLTCHDPAPQTTTLAYHAAGEIMEITDARGATTFFAADEAGRIYEARRGPPANPAIRLRYDLAGRPVELIDRNGQSIGYGYDVLGRLTSVNEPDWPAGAPAQPGKKVSIDYDRLGRRLRVDDSEVPGPCLYAYDAAGRLTRKQDPFGWSLLYAYDERNDLVRLHDEAGIVDLRFQRDPAGRVTSVADSAWHDPSRSFHFIHNQGSRVDNLYRIEGPSGLSTRFAYDANRQLTEAVHLRQGTSLGSYGYAYRNDGLLGESTGAHAGQYDYDGMKRLVRESDSGMRDGYDGVGNRLWRASHPPAPAQQSVYDADNRLTHDPAGDTSFSYDANGNLLERQPPAGAPTRYVYDGANRLREVQRGNLRVAYQYDFSGRLLERRRKAGATTQAARYRYANQSIVATADDSDNVRTLYTRSDSGRLLRRRSATTVTPAPSSDPHSLLYAHDGLGSVIGLFDWDGHDHLAVDYDAWGHASSQGPAAAELFRYRGGLQDPDTGLLCFGRRWYDPRLGRWISQDPLLTGLLASHVDPLSALADVANLYAYVGDNPLNRADLSGLGNGGFWDWLRSTILGKTLEARARAQGARPETGVKGSPTEEVQKKSPKKSSRSDEPGTEEAEAEEPGGESPEFEPGAGEGSRAPSTERTYSHPERWATQGASHGAATAVAAGGAAAVVIVIAAPVEVPAAIGAGIVAGLNWLVEAL
jgi:RHS repeat-associated protein